MNETSPSSSSSCKVIYIHDPSPKTKNNPFHPLSGSTRQHIFESWKDGMKNDEIKCMVLIGEGNHFSAGADISEFNDSDAINNISLTDLCNSLENSEKPIVAAMDGVALGGGLELALSCHIRISTPSMVCGLPEVTLGLIPGAGGTQRLPRLVGIPAALNWMLTGQRIRAKHALQANLISQITSEKESLLDVAVQWANYCALMTNISHLQTCRRTLVPETPYAEIANEVGKKCRVLPKDMGGQAQHAIINAVSYASGKFEDGMVKESELFWDLLLNSKQSAALRHVFMAQRKVTQPVEKTPASHPLLHPTQAIIGVVGAGTMGSGIAASFLLGGYKNVILVDTQPASLQRGSKLIASILQKKGINSSASLQTSTKLQDLSNCHLIVEAVFEKLELKQSIFQNLHNIVKSSQALLLTNTSTMDIEQITKTLPRSRQPYLAGMHFFSPAHIMKLVEIVITPSTSASTTALIQKVTKQYLKKVGVVVKNSTSVPGFVGNRMVAPYTSQACLLLVENNVTVDQVDKAMTTGYLGMPMGPLAMADLAGNDVGYLIRASQLLPNPKTRKPTNLRYSTVADELTTQLKRVGQKADKGWYDYITDISTANKKKKKKKVQSPQVSQLIQKYRMSPNTNGSRVLPYNSESLTNEDIVYKALFPLVNEGFKLLEEGVAQHPNQIDLIYLYGYGWPAWRGGPMFWANYDVGLSLVLQKLQEWYTECKKQNLSCPHYQPSTLLEHCVQHNISLYDYYNNQKKNKRSNTTPSSKL